MAKGANYDDFANFRTPTQRRNDVQIAMVQTDIKRIDSVLATGREDELKALHIDLDGTYQNLIMNWGSSTYNYIQGQGYTYEYMDESALHDNLVTIRGKLRGFLLQISPDEEDIIAIDESSVSKEKTADNSGVRTNMYDIIKGRNFDAAQEYARIWGLFNTADILGANTTPLVSYIDGCLQFFPDTFRGRALTLNDFNNTYGFKFDSSKDFITVDELVSYCEYVITLCDHLWEYGGDVLDDDAEYLREYLYQTVEGCMDELGLVSAQRDYITIYVDKDPVVTAVSEFMDESLVYDIKSYIHKNTDGDLKKKKTILKYLADDIEPQRKMLKGVNSNLEKNLFQMLQKFIRHNNSENLYIKELSPDELESCYNDIYQMYLLSKLEIENVERKRRVEEVLKNINC